MVATATTTTAARTMAAAMISPRRYIQGRGVLSLAGEQIAPLGNSALIIADNAVWQVAGHTVENHLRAADIQATGVSFQGESSENEINRICEIGRDTGVNVVVGIGGGKTLDVAKAVGYRLGVNWAIIATLASTDAPTSALSVIYTDDGVFEKYAFYPKNPDLVLVDTEVIAQAPVRFLSAGIGDALSTWVEARANLESRKPAMSGGIATMAAAQLAKLCWDTLFTYGVTAIKAVEQKAVTQAVEKIVEANTLLSGLGFESAGLAAAHAIHNGLTTLHEQTHSIMHGEKVAFGTLSQLMMEGRPTDEVFEFIEFCIQVNLPTTLADLNLADVSREDLLRVAERACAPGETIHNMPFPVAPEMTLDAMVAADAMARDYKAKREG